MAPECRRAHASYDEPRAWSQTSRLLRLEKTRFPQTMAAGCAVTLTGGARNSLTAQNHMPTVAAASDAIASMKASLPVFRRCTLIRAEVKINATQLSQVPTVLQNVFDRLLRSQPWTFVWCNWWPVNVL